MSARLLLGAGALCLGVLSAGVASAAIDVTYNTSLPANTGAGPAPAFTGSEGTDYFNNVTGTAGGRSPWEGTTSSGGSYHSIRPTSIATYDYGSAQTFFSIMWGSPDSGGSNRNVLEFLNNATVVKTITGDDVRPNSTSALAPASATGFANVIVKFTGGDVFDAVRLKTGQIAFEWSNAVVPLPAAGLLFATALAVMAWLRRRINVPAPATT